MATASVGTFQLITRGPYSRLFWAGLISSTGDWAALFAQISIADTIAGSKGILVVLGARLLPGLAGGAIGGVLADRSHRKRAIVAADVGRGLLVLALAYVTNLPLLFIVSMALELLTLMGQPARTAAIPGLVGDENLLVANSASLAAAYGTFPVGAALSWGIGLFPALTVLGLPGTTEGVVFAVDSLTYLISAVLIMTIAIADTPVPDERRKRSRFDVRAPLRDLLEGVRFVATHPKVRAVVVGMSVALFGGGMLIVLGKSYAEDVLGADPAGFFAMLTTLGTGGALGIVALSIYGDRFIRRDLVFASSLVITGAGLTATGLIRTIAGGMAWMTLVGLGAGAAYVTGFTHLHENVDDTMRGRTFAALFSLMRVGLLVSMAVAATVPSLIGTLPEPLDHSSRVMVVGGGAVVLMTGFITLWNLRATFRRPKVSADAVRSIAAAARDFTSFRGARDDGALDEDES